MMSPTVAGLVLAWVAIVLLTFALAAISRQVDVLSRLVPGGTTAPKAHPLVGLPLPRQAAGNSSFDDGLAVVVVSAGCTACAKVVSTVRRDGFPSEERRRILFLASDPDALPGLIDVDQRAVSRGVLDDLQVTATPYGIAADSDGLVVAATPLGSPAALTGLLASIPLTSST